MQVRRFEPSASSTEITLAIERCKRLSMSRFVYVSTGMLILNCHKGFRVAGGSSRRSQPQSALTFSTGQTSCCLSLVHARLDVRLGSASAPSPPVGGRPRGAAPEQRRTAGCTPGCALAPTRTSTARGAPSSIPSLPKGYALHRSMRASLNPRSRMYILNLWRS